MNWPTENEWDEENGMMRERRLNVLEIVLRAILDPMFATSDWFFSCLFPALEDIAVWVLDSLTRTLHWLDRKYSRGKDKKHIEGYDPYNNDEIRMRIISLIEQNNRMDIYRIVIHPRYQAELRDRTTYLLPDAVFGYPIVWGDPNSSTELALEVHHLHSPILPMDNDYSGVMKQ